MNANPKFLAASAHVDEAAVHPLPRSRKVYVTGARLDFRVPMREISQSDTPASFGAEKNPPVYVYDTSGPYTDPAAEIDIRAGRPALRARWIEERSDTQLLDGPTSGYGRERLADPKLAEMRFNASTNDDASPGFELLLQGRLVEKAKNFRTAKVFEDFVLDFCCGGKKTIQDACREKGINPDTILSTLANIETSNGSSVHFHKWELDFLIDYIVTNHHSYVLREITTIAHHLQKVASKHGENHPEIFKVETQFNSLREELMVHMQKEEKMLFPYINNLVIARKNSLEFPHPPFGSAAGPVAVMENEHDNAGRIMHEINSLTNSFNPPEDACTTFRTLYSELAEFEKDLHVHIHLENNILFPNSLSISTRMEASSMEKAHLQPGAWVP